MGLLKGMEVVLEKVPPRPNIVYVKEHSRKEEVVEWPQVQKGK